MALLRRHFMTVSIVYSKRQHLKSINFCSFVLLKVTLFKEWISKAASRVEEMRNIK